MRQLGLFERWYVASAQCGVMRNVAMTMSMKCPAGASIPSQRALRAAALKLCLQHPMLIASIGKIAGCAVPHWIVSEHCGQWLRDCVACVPRCDAETYLRELERQHTSQPGDAAASGLLWRLILVSNGADTEAEREFEIIFLFHHALLDGNPTCSSPHACRAVGGARLSCFRLASLRRACTLSGRARCV